MNKLFKKLDIETFQRTLGRGRGLVFVGLLFAFGMSEFIFGEEKIINENRAAVEHFELHVRPVLFKKLSGLSRR